MAFTETTTVGYGSRVGNSFKAIGSGLLLFVIGTALLWWNEGRAVKTEKMLNEAGSAYVEMENPSKKDASLEGELVCGSAMVTTEDSLSDAQFGIGAKAIALGRNVEYYQWVEHAQQTRNDKLGGKEEIVTTYTYSKEWESQPVESAQFHDPFYQKKNMVLTTFESSEQWAENVSFGAYRLNESLVHCISSVEPLQLSLSEELLKQFDKATQTAYERFYGVVKKQPSHSSQQPVQPAALNDSVRATLTDSAKAVVDSIKAVTDSIQAVNDSLMANAQNKKEQEYIHQVGNMLYFGRVPGSPEVGDVRITFEKIVPAKVTVMAVVSGDTFKPFKAKNGKRFQTLVMGVKSGDEIIDAAKESNTMVLWFIRIIGILMVIGGLKGIFGFLSMILKVIPFVANIVEWGIGVVCSVVGVAWSLIVIAIAWLFYRPLLGISLLALAGFLIWFFAFKGKDKLKTMVSVTLWLCALVGVQAQTIENGSKWWDGMVLYTATVNEAYGSVEMNGIWAHPGSFRFKLSKVMDKQGKYVLAADAPDAILPVRGELGWNVDYIRQDGMYFLAIRKPNGDICHTLVLTPDNVENCTAQEKWAESQPVSDIITGMLLNPTYLGQFPKAQLRLMRNEILARHGWRFQSQDLKDYFGSQAWYKPVADNNTIRLNIIEQTNLQLIKSEEAVPERDRIKSEQFANLPGRQPVAEDFPGGLADDGRGPDEVDGKEVWTVSTEAEFLGALGSNRTILIGDDVHLNLSRVLEDGMFFKKVPGRRWSSDATAIISKEPLVVSEDVFDGRQLTLVNFSNLIIKGGRNASIEVDPRYAFCLNLVNCDHIEVRNLIMGHTEGGNCSGGVIGVNGGRQNLVSDCELYGCGTYGVDLIETTDFQLTNSAVHDCTYGIMEMRSSMGVRFVNCDFFNNREYTLIEGHGIEGLSFIDCRFFANWGDAPLFSLDNEFFLSGCEIYHPTENLGTIDMADQSGKNNKFHPNPLDTSIEPRNIGPK